MEKVILTSNPIWDIKSGIGCIIADIIETRENNDFEDGKILDIMCEKCEIAYEAISENITEDILNSSNSNESRWIPDLEAIYLEKLKEAGL